MAQGWRETQTRDASISLLSRPSPDSKQIAPRYWFTVQDPLARAQLELTGSHTQASFPRSP
jgi:hypothetical protein